MGSSGRRIGGQLEDAEYKVIVAFAWELRSQTYNNKKTLLHSLDGVSRERVTECISIFIYPSPAPEENAHVSVSRASLILSYSFTNVTRRAPTQPARYG